MTEEASQRSQIIEVRSFQDLARLNALDDDMLKFVHLKNQLANGEVSDTIIIGPESKYAHWELTGLDRETAQKTPVFNAGLVYKAGENDFTVLGFSGGLSSEEGEEFTKLVRNSPDFKRELNRTTADKLNEKCGGEYFQAK